jgi:hypothetical protein
MILFGGVLVRDTGSIAANADPTLHAVMTEKDLKEFGLLPHTSTESPNDANSSEPSEPTKYTAPVGPEVGRNGRGWILPINYPSAFARPSYDDVDYDLVADKFGKLELGLPSQEASKALVVYEGSNIDGVRACPAMRVEKELAEQKATAATAALCKQIVKVSSGPLTTGPTPPYLRYQPLHRH